MSDALGIIAMTIVAPIWIVSHYATKWKLSKGLSKDDAHMLESLWKTCAGHGEPNSDAGSDPRRQRQGMEEQDMNATRPLDNAGNLSSAHGRFQAQTRADAIVMGVCAGRCRLLLARPHRRATRSRLLLLWFCCTVPTLAAVPVADLARRRAMNGNSDFPEPNPRRLYRDTEHGMLAGVCAGIADYFGFSVRGFRLLTVLSCACRAAGDYRRLPRGLVPAAAQTDRLVPRRGRGNVLALGPARPAFHDGRYSHAVSRPRRPATGHRALRHFAAIRSRPEVPGSGVTLVSDTRPNNFYRRCSMISTS